MLSIASKECFSTLRPLLEEALAQENGEGVELYNTESHLLFPPPTPETPLVQFIHQVLCRAIEQRASDIHFEPYERYYRIRFRQDGLLTEIASFPIHLSPRIAARLKVMAKLDIAERRKPQDGRFQLNHAQAQIDFRVSTCPTIHGEKIVLRILDTKVTHLTLETLGLNSSQLTTFTKHLCKPQGLILVTGPTGSGKTVTLYAALQFLNTIEKNISTVEDPVEIKIPGINQVQVHSKSGIIFSTILRSFLRQDPDVIMVGEIRDLETADIAIRAAQTGHLVLSTLHTNSAIETITRLLNLGVDPLNLASSLSLILAQRLARRLCNHCKTKDRDALSCEHCLNGYRGRIGLFEVLPIDKQLSQLIMQRAIDFDLNPLTSMYQSGMEKIKQGLTTLIEVERVTSE